MFQDILQFTPQLAQVYLTVDDKRENKLLNFDYEKNRNKDSKLFLIAIGWDEVPNSGTIFLLFFKKFFNRTASSSENYLLVGSNAKENWLIVHRYIQKLRSDIKIIEKEQFIVVANEKSVLEFKLDPLPNDIITLSFLERETVIKCS